MRQSNRGRGRGAQPVFMDRGGEAVRVDAAAAARWNSDEILPLWTGETMRLFAMCIPREKDSGLDRRPSGDQMIHIVSGQALVKMGTSQYRPGVTERLYPGETFFIPAGVWYNIISVGSVPLKLYRILACGSDSDPT